MTNEMTSEHTNTPDISRYVATPPRAIADRGELSAEQLIQYKRDGYVKNLRIFDEDAVMRLQQRYTELADRLPQDIDINRVNMWHKANRWIYEIGRTPLILDYVQSVLGENFYQWGGQFFVKHPDDGSEVPMHQDSQYWPLTPPVTATVWLAIFDADEGNGAMQVVRGSHTHGDLPHHTVNDDHYVLAQRIDTGHVNDADLVTLSLKAGEISLHDSALIHGSRANHSDRMRCGLTMRYCPTHVRCDLKVWPTFETYLVRGEDQYAHNPTGKVPRGDGFPVKRFQHSSEFE